MGGAMNLARTACLAASAFLASGCFANPDRGDCVCTIPDGTIRYQTVLEESCERVGDGDGEKAADLLGQCTPNYFGGPCWDVIDDPTLIQGCTFTSYDGTSNMVVGPTP